MGISYIQPSSFIIISFLSMIPSLLISQLLRRLRRRLSGGLVIGGAALQGECQDVGYKYLLNWGVLLNHIPTYLLSWKRMNYHALYPH